MLVIVVMLTVIGMVMDPFGAVILVSATIAQPALQIGIDPLHSKPANPRSNFPIRTGTTPGQFDCARDPFSASCLKYGKLKMSTINQQ